MMSVETQSAPPERPLPSPGDIQEANELLNILQRILIRMGTDERRNSPEFQEIKEQYKQLGTEIHQVRKLMTSQGPAQATLSRPGGGLPPKPVSLLERVKQQKGFLYTPPPPRRPAVTGIPTPPTAGGAAAPAAPGPVAPSPVSAPSPPPGMVFPPGAETPPAPVGPGPLPPDLPLPLPKFKATLGPAGHSGAVSAGEEVRNLQKLLAHLGHDCPQTGTYDLKTIRAVQAFQKLHDIPVTNLVGVNMRRLLNEMVSGGT